MNSDEKELLYRRLKHAIFKINGLMLSHSDQRIARHRNLTTARARILGLMIRHGQPMTVPQLTHELGLTRQAVGRVINAMLDDGFLIQTDNPLHQTSKLLTVTASGREAYQHVVNNQSELSRLPPESITDDALLITANTLQTLVDRFEWLVKHER
jgi:DNA-binding MarR family transcriptional regulator